MGTLKRRLALMGLGFLIAACVKTNAVVLGNAPTRPKVALDQVAVYRTADQVRGKYQEIALLNSGGDTRYTSEAAMVKNMRYTAGQMGANAVILDAVSEPGTGAKVASALLGTNADRKGKGIAIYVYPDSTTKP